MCVFKSAGSKRDMATKIKDICCIVVDKQDDPKICYTCSVLVERAWELRCTAQKLQEQKQIQAEQPSKRAAHDDTAERQSKKRKLLNETNTSPETALQSKGEERELLVDGNCDDLEDEGDGGNPESNVKGEMPNIEDSEDPEDDALSADEIKDIVSVMVSNQKVTYI